MGPAITPGRRDGGVALRCHHRSRGVAGDVRNVRVLEVGSSIAGAYCGRLFAAAGADVVLVEPPGSEGLRALAPFLDAPSAGSPPAGALHEYLNAGKRSVGVSLDAEELDELLAWADLVVTTCDGDPEWAHRFHARVEATNPAAVHVVLSGFGLTGPYSRWRR